MAVHWTASEKKCEKADTQERGTYPRREKSITLRGLRRRRKTHGEE